MPHAPVSLHAGTISHVPVALLPLPLQFLAAWIGVWLGRVLQAQVDYLKAENLLLREKLGTKPVRLTDAERRRLAMLGKASANYSSSTIEKPPERLRRNIGTRHHRARRRYSATSKGKRLVLRAVVPFTRCDLPAQAI